jgi:hypothetical protein
MPARDTVGRFPVPPGVEAPARRTPAQLDAARRTGAKRSAGSDKPDDITLRRRDGADGWYVFRARPPTGEVVPIGAVVKVGRRYAAVTRDGRDIPGRHRTRRDAITAVRTRDVKETRR